MENTVTISLKKYDKFKYQQVEINELKKLLEDKSIVVERFYENTVVGKYHVNTINYKLKEYESKVIEENERLYNELNKSKKELHSPEESYSKNFEKLFQLKNKNLFQLIKWWFKNKNN